VVGIAVAVRNTSFRAIYVMIFGQTIYKSPMGLFLQGLLSSWWRLAVL